MDPNATLADIIADHGVWANPSTPEWTATISAKIVIEHAEALRGWVARGGFPPADANWRLTVDDILTEISEYYADPNACYAA
ncbi:hypothetical protein ACFFX1_08150 [Dactylosporangium sucinum]|uniref:Uncharacterized protein n=1 Tax=Dactylosporangium sucinum TaxID=1424081 RepID=A0A917U3J4_9ACTN|nr:hypothetical protein [Dactylosporangium sucinum]GGM55572.1 hypothetical protein GCM10007977_066580 [Dactylosporangium sucinum]